MKKLQQYIQEFIGFDIKLQPLLKEEAAKLPMYLNEGYTWQKTVIAHKQCILAEAKEANNYGIVQTEKHFDVVKKILGLPVIAVFDQLEAYNRKRLVERKLAFIVPGKQMYIPGFLIDLKEYGLPDKKEKARLIPTAQVILLVHILDKYNNKKLEAKTFKELAVLLQTNPMAITRAVDNLKHHELVEVTGEKEKFIRFISEKNALWDNAIDSSILLNPVLKKVYVDEMPHNIFLLQSNTSALPAYSDMNPSRQEYFAIEKTKFYALQKSNALINANEYEGRYCLEVWKYNPEILNEAEQPDDSVVDPLSLYLSLRDTNDERIEMALEQIIEKYIW